MAPCRDSVLPSTNVGWDTYGMVEGSSSTHDLVRVDFGFEYADIGQIAIVFGVV